MDNWRKEGRLSLLAKIHPKDVSGIFSKVYVIDPGEFAFRRKNGVSEGHTKTGLLTIMSFWEILQSIFLKDRIQAYVADVSQFSVDMHIIGDNPIEGSVNTQGDASDRNLVEQYIIAGRLQFLDSEIRGMSMRIQAEIDTNKIDQFLASYIKGRNLVLTTDIWAGIDQLLLQKIFAPIIEQNEYKQVKGHDIRPIITSKARNELKNYLDSHGLRLSNLSFRWHASKKKFETETGIDPENPNIIKFQLDGEEFEFTYGQFFLWMGIIFVAFIAVLIFIFS